MTEKDGVCLQDHCGRCCAGVSACCPRGCPGCGERLQLTAEEEAFLRLFSQTPFLPVAGTRENELPVYLAEEGTAPENTRSIITVLHQKGLIRIDYDLPLANYDYDAYKNYPVRGSMALTWLGQELLDELDVLG